MRRKLDVAVTLTILLCCGISCVRKSRYASSSEGEGNSRTKEDQLSLRSGMTIKNVQKIYRYPYSIVTTETLDRLARVLGVDASELIESVEER